MALFNRVYLAKLFIVLVPLLLFVLVSVYGQQVDYTDLYRKDSYIEAHKFVEKYWIAHPADSIDSLSANALMHNVENEQPAICIGDSVVLIIDSLLGNLNSTRYSNTRYIVDLNKGFIQLDCSFWVKQIISRVSPMHYESLTSDGSLKSSVVARDYYNYFKALTKGAVDSKGLWMRVADISEAMPGDLIVYKYGTGAGYNSTGHVMLIYSKPIRSSCKDTTQFELYISDSANSGHAEDTRNGKGTLSDRFSYHAQVGRGSSPSGIGVGKMWFNTGEKPYFRWNSCDGRKNHYSIVIGRMIRPENFTP